MEGNLYLCPKIIIDSEKLMYAPIVVSVYDRLEHLQRCVESMKPNDLAPESELYIQSEDP